MDISTVASPLIDVEVEVPKELKNLFMSLPRIVEVGIAAVGDAANYALVWEWGNTRQTEQGPNTSLGSNPAGEEVWLSIQAPTGWIAINESLMWDVILEEIQKISFEGNDNFHVKMQFENAASHIGERIKALLQDTVPIDSGELKDSLVVVESGDSLLDETDEGVFSIGEEG
jgi:hypothetical protein